MQTTEQKPQTEPIKGCCCDTCEALRTARKNAGRRARHAAYRDLGMVRVRGSLGGVYYE